MLLALDPVGSPLSDGFPDSCRTDPVPGVGVDTVRLRGPAAPELLELLPHRRFEQMVDDDTGEIAELQRGGWTAVPVGYTSARVVADQRRGPEVAIEFSAPTVLRGHNLRPLEAGMLGDVVDAVWAALDREFVGFPPLDELRLVRLDIDRDFQDVHSISTTLQALSLRKAARLRTDRLERGRGGSWQSLTRGVPGRWIAVGYDKGEQLAEAALRIWDPVRREHLLAAAVAGSGLLRWELQLRRRRLLEVGIGTIEDVTEEDIVQVAREHFHRTRFGDTISGGTERVQRALAQLTSTEQRGVLSLLSADLIGLPVPMSHNNEDKYRRIARRLNVEPSDLLVVGDGERLRLDFDSGIQRVGDEVVAGG